MMEQVGWGWGIHTCQHVLLGESATCDNAVCCAAPKWSWSWSCSWETNRRFGEWFQSSIIFWDCPSGASLQNSCTMLTFISWSWSSQVSESTGQQLYWVIRPYLQRNEDWLQSNGWRINATAIAAVSQVQLCKPSPNHGFPQTLSQPLFADNLEQGHKPWFWPWVRAKFGMVPGSPNLWSKELRGSLLDILDLATSLWSSLFWVGRCQDFTNDIRHRISLDAELFGSYSSYIPHCLELCLGSSWFHWICLCSNK